MSKIFSVTLITVDSSHIPLDSFSLHGVGQVDIIGPQIKLPLMKTNTYTHGQVKEAVAMAMVTEVLSALLAQLVIPFRSTSPSLPAAIQQPHQPPGISRVHLREWGWLTQD